MNSHSPEAPAFISQQWSTMRQTWKCHVHFSSFLCLSISLFLPFNQKSVLHWDKWHSVSNDVTPRLMSQIMETLQYVVGLWRNYIYLFDSVVTLLKLSYILSFYHFLHSFHNTNIQTFALLFLKWTKKKNYFWLVREHIKITFLAINK